MAVYLKEPIGCFVALENVQAALDAFLHWTKIGYSEHASAQLVAAKYEDDYQTKRFALDWVLRHTNIKESEL